jgi:hypothetical protein
MRDEKFEVRPLASANLQRLKALHLIADHSIISKYML